MSLSPGRVAAQRIASVPSDVTLHSLQQGWSLVTPGGVVRLVTVRVAFEELTGQPAIRVAVAKGYSGKTIVDVTNTSNAAFQAAYVLNQLPAPSSGTPGLQPYTTIVSRTRTEFFGATDPPLTPADPRRLVMAAYYPWFGPGNYGNPKLSDRPLDERDTMQYPGVLSMTQQARAAGIDGFVMSWAGEEFSGWRFDLALQAAEATNGLVVPYLEMMEVPQNASGKADQAAVVDWITDAVSRASSPAFLRSDGVPVVFVFTMERVGVYGWTNILNALAAQGTPVKLVGDAPVATFGSVQWGVHRYNPNFLSQADLTKWNRSTMLEERLLATADATGPHLFAATVSPGYDDTKLRGNVNPVVARGPNGERYLATWTAALAAQPDWVLVTSWNEWFEGTAVEPSVKYGTLALQQTAQQSAIFSP